MEKEKQYIAVGDNNFWYAFGSKEYCESQARKAFEDDDGDFGDIDLPLPTEITIFEVKEVGLITDN